MLTSFGTKNILRVFLLIASIFLSGPHWIRPIAAVLLIYYFFFSVNLFRKRFNQDDWLTKVFFDFTKTPFYLGAFIVIVVFFIGRYMPQDDVIEAYVVAVIGAGVSLVGMMKRKNEGRVR